MLNSSLNLSTTNLPDSIPEKRRRFPKDVNDFQCFSFSTTACLLSVACDLGVLFFGVADHSSPLFLYLHHRSFAHTNRIYTLSHIFQDLYFIFVCNVIWEFALTDVNVFFGSLQYYRTVLGWKAVFSPFSAPALNSPPSLFTNFAWMTKARAGVFTMATDWIAAYPVDGYSGHYPCFVERLFIERTTIRWTAVLSSG